jgi:hypothetical protein
MSKNKGTRALQNAANPVGKKGPSAYQAGKLPVQKTEPLNNSKSK